MTDQGVQLPTLDLTKKPARQTADRLGDPVPEACSGTRPQMLTA
jgi:hypothetical protein